MIAGTLEIQLLANLARLQQDMDKAKSSVAGAVNDINRVLGKIGVGLSFAGIAALGAAAIRASEDAAQAQRKLDAVIRATGNASGYTADQLSKLADRMARVSTFDDEGFRVATATLLRFGNIGGANLEKVLKLSADYAALTGGDLVSAAETLGKALNNPAEGLKRLERNFGDLGKETEEAIKLQQDMGNQSGALALAIEALQGKIGGADATMNAGLTGSVKQLRKALSELMETMGSVADNSVVTGFIDGVSASLRGLKEVIEGPWALKLAALLAVMQGRGIEELTRIGNLAPGAVTPSGSGGGGGMDLSGQDARGLAHLERMLRERNAAAAKANEELARENERYRQLDARGWVAYIEAQTAEYEDGLREQAKLTEGYYDTQDELRQMDLEGQAWLARNVVKIVEAETAEVEALRQQSFINFWNQVGDMAGNFFSDLVMNGKSAFDNLKRMIKSLLAEMIALFAKRWILNMAAGGSMLGSAGAAFGAGSDGSLAGSLFSMGSSAFSAAGTIGGAWGSFAAGAQGATLAAGLAGPTTAGATGMMGAGASMSGVYSALAAIPVWGWIAMAVIGAVAFFSGRGGGPKPGGSFMGSYDAQGNFLGSSAVPGTDNGRFFTPSSGDSAMEELTTSIASGIFSSIRRFGGTTSGLSLGFGFDQDPEGTADSRVSAMVRNASGGVVFDQTLTAGRDDEDFQRAVGLITQRAIVAGLQASDLPESIALIFDAIDPLTATAEQLTAAFADAQTGMATLALGITGLNFQTLGEFSADGESLDQTLQRIGGAWSWFQENFTTDAERLDRATTQVADTFTALGIAVPASITDFRLLVEGIDVSTEAGRTLWSTLMGVAPAFLTVANSTSTAADAVEDFNDAIIMTADLAGRIADEVRDSRMRQLDQIVGARSGLRGFLDSTRLNSDLTVLTPQERLAEAERQYEQIRLLAMGGDLGAAGRLGGAAETYLRIARELYASSGSYVDIFNRVTGQVESVDARLAIDEQILRATLGMATSMEQVRDLLIEIRDNSTAQADRAAVATRDTALSTARR